MAKETKDAPAKADVPALSLDDIESVEPEALPTSDRGVLSDDEIKIVEAILTASSNGKRARGPKLADKPTAQTAAARIKRLISNYWRQKEITEHPTIGTRTVPRDDGYAWVILQKPAADAPEVHETDGDDAEGESPETTPATA